MRSKSQKSTVRVTASTLGGIFRLSPECLDTYLMKLNKITLYQVHMTLNNVSKIMSLKIKVTDDIFQKWTYLVEAHQRTVHYQRPSSFMMGRPAVGVIK